MEKNQLIDTAEALTAKMEAMRAAQRAFEYAYCGYHLL